MSNTGREFMADSKRSARVDDIAMSYQTGMRKEVPKATCRGVTGAQQPRARSRRHQTKFCVFGSVSLVALPVQRACGGECQHCRWKAGVVIGNTRSRARETLTYPFDPRELCTLCAPKPVQIRTGCMIPRR